MNSATIYYFWSEYLPARAVMLAQGTVDAPVLTEAHMIAAVIALSGVIAYLYKRAEDKADVRFNELKTRIDECEEDRQNLWAELRKVMGDQRTDP